MGYEKEKNTSGCASRAAASSELGFSLTELIVSMVLTLAVLGIAIATYSGALSTREGENSRTDALTSAQAALNVMTREIGNSGYGLLNNGIVLQESGAQRLRVRANINNTNNTTDDEGEDMTFFYDPGTQSVLRHERISGTSGVINRISEVQFSYLDCGVPNPLKTAPCGDDEEWNSTPTANTSQVSIKLMVMLPDRAGQPRDERVELSTKITLRNSPYMLRQY
jgi:type II secretory pathway pseudopilin PulG